jgi:hypothetical protein
MSKKSNRFIKAIVRIPREQNPFSSLPPELRGPRQNRFGGHRCHHMRPFKGAKFGPANEGSTVTDPERRLAIIDGLRKRGFID